MRNWTEWKSAVLYGVCVLFFACARSHVVDICSAYIVSGVDHPATLDKSDCSLNFWIALTKELINKIEREKKTSGHAWKLDDRNRFLVFLHFNDPDMQL